jgi:hypothetical protein
MSLDCEINGIQMSNSMFDIISAKLEKICVQSTEISKIPLTQSLSEETKVIRKYQEKADEM